MAQEKPLNKFELENLFTILNPGLLCGLTGVHGDKLLHYIFGMSPRTLPKEQLPWTDIETERLLFLQKLVKQLKGSYNDEGVRQWFRRQRVQLGNKKPAEFLYGIDWDPDDPKIQKLLELVRSISSAGT